MSFGWFRAILKNGFRYGALYFLTPFRNNIIRDGEKNVYQIIISSNTLCS